ncbi:MAG: hypothetical protein LLF28_07345 [Nitrospiraceae bacterium]|nr:hypothetical protein [Nitrospiraceae bacterium]
MKYCNSNSGLSLIATIIALMIFVLFAVVAVSLITTESNIGLQEEQGTQAFYIADGGLQYAVKRNNFPNYGVSPAVNLGIGSFTVSVPTLTAAINNSTTGPINVSSTDGFIFNPGDPTRYWIMLCDTTTNPTPDINAGSSNCEKISFTTKSTATTFTGGTRGRDSSAAIAHLANTVVLMYSWNTSITTTTARNLRTAHQCLTAATTICVNSTANFAASGFIRINEATGNNIEDVFYKGIGSNTTVCGAGCTACLGTNGCIRLAYDDNGTSNGIDHNGTRTIYQSTISVLTTSKGTVANIFSGNVIRSVQSAIMPLQ